MSLPCHKHNFHWTCVNESLAAPRHGGLAALLAVESPRQPPPSNGRRLNPARATAQGRKRPVVTFASAAEFTSFLCWSDHELSPVGPVLACPFPRPVAW